VKRFRGGLVFKAHSLFVSLNSRLESNKEEEEEGTVSCGTPRRSCLGFGVMLLRSVVYGMGLSGLGVGVLGVGFGVYGFEGRFRFRCWGSSG